MEGLVEPAAHGGAVDVIAEVLLAAELALGAGPLGEAALEAAAVGGVLGSARGDELLALPARHQRQLGEAAAAAAHVALRDAVRLVAVAADLARPSPMRRPTCGFKNREAFSIWMFGFVFRQKSIVN